MGEVGFIYGVAFIGFTAFFNIAVMNVLTGLFVDKVMKLALPDREEHTKNWKRMQRAHKKEVKKLLEDMDESGDGLLTRDEFVKHIQDRRLKAYFACLELDIKDAQLFFDALAHMNHQEEVGIDDFVEGCVRM